MKSENSIKDQSNTPSPATHLEGVEGNVIVLVKRGDPSEKPMLYACPKCGQAHSPKIYACREEQAHEAARRAAEECWQCRTHDTCEACGKETPKGWLKCETCRESAKLQKAEVVDASTIENCFNADGEYFHDTWEAIEDGASYVYGSTFTPFRIDFDNLIENVLDDHHEDASTHDLNGLDALKTAIDAFNEAQTSGSYHEDPSKVAYLPKPDGADATTEGQPDASA